MPADVIINVLDKDGAVQPIHYKDDGVLGKAPSTYVNDELGLVQQTAINTKLTTLNGYSDGIEGSLNSLVAAIGVPTAVQPISDNGGSLTVDSPQIPASIGQKLIATSMAVVLPSDATGASALQVQGSVASGGAIATTNSVRISGSDGTNQKQIHVFDNAAQAGQNGVLIAPAFLSVSASTTIAAAIGSTDVANFGHVSVQVTAQGTGSTVTFQACNDNATWVSVALVLSSAAQSTAAVSTTTTGVYHGPLPARYFRCNVTGISALTTSITTVFSGVARSLATVGVGANISGMTGLTLPAADAHPATTNLATALQLYNGSTSDMMRNVTTLKPAQSTATASGSALALWTPASGKKFRLRTVRGRASIAGRYEVRDGAATVLAYIYLSANTWTTLIDMDANGTLSAAANNILNIYNVSGSAADMDFLCSGNEE